jgi:hypothetical protein
MSLFEHWISDLQDHYFESITMAWKRRPKWVVSSKNERKKLACTQPGWNLPATGVVTTEDTNGRRTRTVRHQEVAAAAVTSNDSSSIDDSSFSCPESIDSSSSADEELSVDIVDLTMEAQRLTLQEKSMKPEGWPNLILEVSQRPESNIGGQQPLPVMLRMR